MEKYFVLDADGHPRPEPDVEVWERWCQDANRGIARTLVAPDVAVLTIFRGVDDDEEPREEPLLFETTVFGGVLDGEEQRHATKADALAAHAELAAWCRIGNDRDASVTRRKIA